MAPQLSVIVPVYNVEKCLPLCIESVQKQTYKNWELILVDDGSQDNSGTICDEYAAKDSRIKVIHKANGGVNTARNRGLDEAEGEFITFIDADDEFYTDDTFEKNLRYFEQDISKEIDIVSMPLYLETKVGKFKKKLSQFEKRVIRDKMEMFFNWYNGRIIDGSYCGKFYRKRIFDGWRLTEDLIFTEDNYHVPDLCEKVRCVVVSGEGGYMYRCNTTSAIHSDFSMRKRMDQLKTQVRLCRYMLKFENSSKEEGTMYLAAIENAYYLYCSREYANDALTEISKVKRRLRNGRSGFQRILNLSISMMGYKTGFKMVKGIVQLLRK